ncbi:MAG: hypothetical protein RLZZ165_914, partial [Bacteroidota bacterium]
MRDSSIRHLFSLLLSCALLPATSLGQSQPAVPVGGVSATTEPKPSTSFDGKNGIFVPEWTTDLAVSDPADMEKTIKAPWFRGASLDRKVANLPYYDFLVPVGKDQRLTLGEIQAENPEEIYSGIFQGTCKAAGLPQDAAWYPDSHVLTGSIITIQGEDYQHVMVYPILVSASGSSYKRADVIRYSISRQHDTNRRAGGYNSRQGYASESVLRNGTWYKFPVTSEGIYALDQSFFSGIGVDPATVDPRSVRIFGNGGAALPQTAGA